MLAGFLILLAVSGCDRRAAQPLEDSSTTDTGAAPVPAESAPIAGTAIQADAIPSSDPCIGQTGQAETACLQRDREVNARAAGPAVPTSVPPAANSDADTEAGTDSNRPGTPQP